MRFMVIGAALLLSAASVGAQDLRQQVNGYVAGNRQAIVSELTALLAIPNVAADTPNIRRNAEFLQRMLTRHGLHAELLETTGNPLVFAETPATPGAPIVLFYCH